MDLKYTNNYEEIEIDDTIRAEYEVTYDIHLDASELGLLQPIYKANNMQ